MAYKSKQFFFGLIKLIAVIAAIGVIYHKLFYSKNLSWLAFKTTILDSDILNFFTLILLFSLSIINWSLEILKWQKLVSAIENISFYKSFKHSRKKINHKN